MGAGRGTPAPITKEASVPFPKFPKLEDAEWVRSQYEDAGLSCREIGEKVGATSMTVHRALKEHGIQRRRPGATGRYGFPQLADREWLVKRYVDERRSIGEMAVEVGCTDAGVLDAMRRLSVPRRTQLEARRERGKRLRERVALREARTLYDEGEGLEQIGKRYSVSGAIVRDVLEQAGIRIRSRAEQSRINLARLVTREKIFLATRAQQRPTGVRGMKRAIAEGDMCAFCGASECLQLHHLNAVRSDNSDGNLVPLCTDCHDKIEWFIRHAENGLRIAYANKKEE